MFTILNTRKLMVKAVLLFLLSLAYVSCNNQSMDSCIVNGTNDYWLVYDEAGPGYLGGAYFKFNADGTSTHYRKKLNGEFEQITKDGDLIFDDIDWVISKDSILKWGEHSLDIVDYNDNTFILYLNRQDRYLFLFKEKKGSKRKGSQYYIDKRKEYPEKYPEPYSSVNNQ